MLASALSCRLVVHTVSGSEDNVLPGSRPPAEREGEETGWGMASFEGKTVPGSGPVHFKRWVNRKAEGEDIMAVAQKLLNLPRG